MAEYIDPIISLAERIQASDLDNPDEDLIQQLNSMPAEELIRLRKKLPAKNKTYQNFVAPFEHLAFARDYTAEHPVIGSLGLAAATPIYTGAKYLGLTKARSDPSLAEMAAGYRGIGQGLAKYFTK